MPPHVPWFVQRFCVDSSSLPSSPRWHVPPRYGSVPVPETVRIGSSICKPEKSQVQSRRQWRKTSKFASERDICSATFRCRRGALLSRFGALICMFLRTRFVVVVVYVVHDHGRMLDAWLLDLGERPPPRSFESDSPNPFAPLRKILSTLLLSGCPFLAACWFCNSKKVHFLL